MKKDNFRVVIYMKKYILSLDDVLNNFPKKEKVLKDRILNISYDILELILLSNLKEERKELQQEIIAKCSILDFYFEMSFKKRYISEKQCISKCNELNTIVKMIYGWIKNEQCEFI